MNVLVDHGTEQQPFRDGAAVRAVDIEVVRKEFYASYPAEGDEKNKNNTRRHAFTRTMREAQAKELIAVRDIGAVTFVWLAKPEPRE